MRVILPAAEMTMDEETENENHENVPDRRTLIRDAAVLQVKLAVDGLRDLLLVPVSIVAAFISLTRAGARPGTEFYDLLRIGRRSERWINLFGAAEHVHGPPSNDEEFGAEDIDELVSRVETYVVTEYQKGGVPAQAKGRLDDAINALHRLRKRDESSD